MSDVLFVCPRCKSGRLLAAYAVEVRVRCLKCKTNSRSDGHLFDRAAWLRIADPFTAVTVASGMGHKMSARKRRLLACGIGRVVFDWCRNPWFRDALQTAERWADDGTEPRGAEMCRTQLDRVPVPEILRERAEEVRWYPEPVELVFRRQQERERFSWVQLARRCVSDDSQLRSAELTDNNRPLAAQVFRDLLPNPFSPITWNPEWFTSTVRDLARTMYEAREFSAMPILADALQDAGCDDEHILGHCRAEKLHARGCWVLDAILGKS